MIDLDPLVRQLMAGLASELEQHADQLARQALRPDLATTYLDGLVVERVAVDEIVVQLRGDVPNFLEHGLGPQGVGSEGAFDMRNGMLRDRAHQSIPVAPGVFRTMSRNGKPWMHPGFRKHGLLKRTQADIPRLLVRATR